ncbi:MAG: hypothetical protein M1834_008896 [Cirrosporium novae-zelandiae]|nr:MAG: hypothetical protein M1834_008896 [Cirrosporium novae-zelandiae]
MSPIDLSTLQTEGSNPRSTDIDKVSTLELCQIINNEDATVAATVAKCLPIIAAAIDTLTPRVRCGGRVIYVGAGTSGRLGVIDASEIPPTYSAPHEQFVALIAGGDAAMRVAQEGAEDNIDLAKADLQVLKLDPRMDSVIGIAASGRTPYVLSCLSYAKSLGCVTVGVACTFPSTMSESGTVDFMISPVTGAEVVTGSTRMKAGTATKLTLNMLSTGIMIKLGKTFGNMMVDLKASNLKLQQRSRNIIRKLCGSLCPNSDDEIDALISKCNGSVKLALVTLTLNMSVEESARRIQDAEGSLSAVLRRHEEQRLKGEIKEKSQMENFEPVDWVLCVDGGGTKCTAMIKGQNGEFGEGEAGNCNVTDVGTDSAVSCISTAVQRALDALATKKASTPLKLQSIQFSAVLVGLAGYERPGIRSGINSALSALFHHPVGLKLKIMNDIDMLATVAGSKLPVGTSMFVLLAGTGSVAMRYQRQESEFIRTGRSGGWGHVLGDDGGGYWMGRQAIRATLLALDELRNETDGDGGDGGDARISFQDLGHLSQKVMQHFELTEETASDSDLLSTILAPLQSNPNAGCPNIKAKVSSAAKLVLEVGITDPIAQDIMTIGVQELIQALKPLLCLTPSTTARKRPPPDPKNSVLVFGGSLLCNLIYQKAVRQKLDENGICFLHVEVVNQPAWSGAEFLRDCCWTGFKN